MTIKFAGLKQKKNLFEKTGLFNEFLTKIPRTKKLSFTQKDGIFAMKLRNVEMSTMKWSFCGTGKKLQNNAHRDTLTNYTTLQRLVNATR